MSTGAEKLLERMRQTKTGWKPRDLISLYEGFGFVVTNRTNHVIVKHPDFPELRATIPRHNYLLKPYVATAVKLVEKLMVLQQEEAQDESESEG
jgi:hypothetical protein